MILAITQNTPCSKAMLYSATQLAIQLDKNLAICCCDGLWDNIPNDIQYIKSECDSTIFSGLYQFCDANEISFLFIQLISNKSSELKKILLQCRELRIPYMFFKEDIQPLNLSKVIVPVGFLEEELEKAQFASAFGRFCQSEILVLQANDYGTKAALNVSKMKIFFEKFSLNVNIKRAKSDSFKVDKEAVSFARLENAGIVIISASRDYGLDDVIFGSKEFHLIKSSTIPLLLINPRADLYALCD